MENLGAVHFLRGLKHRGVTGALGWPAMLEQPDAGATKGSSQN